MEREDDYMVCAYCKYVKVVLGSQGCTLTSEEKDIFYDTCFKFEKEDDED